MGNAFHLEKFYLIFLIRTLGPNYILKKVNLPEMNYFSNFFYFNISDLI